MEAEAVALGFRVLRSGKAEEGAGNWDDGG